MTSEARRAIRVIRECVEEDRFALSAHFTERMRMRGLFWPDVEAVLQNPSDMRSQGVDQFGREKWVVGGEAANGDAIEVVCAIELDETETIFITLYWE